MNILSTITWSRNEDTSNGASNTFNSQQTTSQDNYNRQAEWGPLHRSTHRLDFGRESTNCRFGKGQKFLGGHKILDYAVGGWAVNFQTTMQNGFPLAIYQSNLNSAIGTSVQRPTACGSLCRRPPVRLSSASTTTSTHGILAGGAVHLR